MATTIRVTPEEVKATAGQMEAKGQEITKLAASANEIVQTLSGRIWSGEAATEYTTKFNTLYNDVSSVTKLISSPYFCLFFLGSFSSNSLHTVLTISRLFRSL